MKFLIFALLIVSSYAIDFDCLKGPSFWCASEENAVKCRRKIECSMINPKIGVVQMSKIKEFKYCELCKEIVGTLEKHIIRQFTEAQFINVVVNNVCSKLEKDLNQLCVTLVRQYEHGIYTELIKIISPNNVCAYIELCSANFKTIGSSETCKICKKVFRVLEPLLTSISPEELKTFLKMTICNKLPASLKFMCDRILGGLTDQVYNLLKSFLIGVVQMSKIKEFKYCELCKKIIDTLEKQIDPQLPEAEYIDFLVNEICPILEKDLNQLCQTLVQQYGHKIFTELTNIISPNNVCAYIELCSANIERIGFSEMSKIYKDVFGIKCKLILSTIKKYIVDHETDIENFIMYSYCKYHIKKTFCEYYMLENFSKFFNEIMAVSDVDTICKFCMKPPYINYTPRQKCVEFEVCERVMEEIINVVNTNNSKFKIMKFLNNTICPELNSLEDECIFLVNTYLPYIFNIARESLNSKILCSRLNLCSTVSLKKMNALLRNLKVKSFQCDMCQFVVQDLKLVLSDANIQTIIEIFLKNEICSHFGRHKESCENDITEDYSAVINLILQYLTPNICSDIRLCTKQSLLHMAKKPFVLGDKRCTWDHGLQCFSRTQAQMCTCELYVWN